MKDEDKKVSQNRQKKEQLVAQVSEKVEKAKGLVFANYQGLTHQQLEAMKKALKQAEAEFVVIKNTLMLLALESKNLADEEKQKFQQPTAVLFLNNDVVAPLKVLAKTIKDLKLPQIKFGLVENRVMSESELIKLSTLPPVEVLRAQLLGQMKSPISGLHRALNWNLQKLVLTLSAIKNSRPADAAPAAAPAEPATQDQEQPAEPATEAVEQPEPAPAEQPTNEQTTETQSEEPKTEEQKDNS